MRTLLLILVMLLSFVLNACGKTEAAVDPNFQFYIETNLGVVDSPEVCSYNHTFTADLELTFCNPPLTIDVVQYSDTQIDMDYVYDSGVLTISNVFWGFGEIHIFVRGQR